MSRDRISSVWNRFQKNSVYYESFREELLALLPSEPRRVLDIGCGSGTTWKNSAAEVHGVEFEEGPAQAASEVLAQVHVGDIQSMPLPYARGFFDCIVFADVLEHLYDPWGTLLRLRPLLAADGHLLISIPNVRYYKILRSLVVEADFPYQHSGVLDIDHVRFFARKNVEWLLQETGFRIENWRDKRRGSSKYRFLNRLLFHRLDDLLTKQFLVLAAPEPDWQPQKNGSGQTLAGKAAQTS